jgi:hypothetical protein
MPGIYDFGIKPVNLSQAFEQGQEKARARGLRELAGEYYGQQDPMLGKIAALGGDAAGMRTDMQGQEDRKRQQLGQFAALLVNAPEAMRPGLYRQMHGQLSQIVPDAPPEYSAEIDGLAQQIAAQYGKGGEGAPAQQRYLQFLASQVPEGERQDVYRNAAGTNPRARSQIYEGTNGAVNINTGTNTATPIMMGGPQAPQQPSAPAQGTNDEVLRVANAMAQAGVPAAQIEAWMAKQPGIQPVSQQETPQQLRKPAPAITPFQQQSLDIRRQSATAAAQARDLAAQARKDAADAKAAAANQAVAQRQAAAVETADGLIRAIDTLTGNPGFGELGTIIGDVKLSTPLARSDVKDAQAQLKNIAGQVALATMSKLKALSSQGATGFGALSAQELKLLENSIATLQSDQISNPELARSLNVIKTSMQKIGNWKAPAAQQAAPAAGGSSIDAILDKYR